MRVVVLGGCGYIGSALVPYLNGRDFDIHVIDAGYYGIPAYYSSDYWNDRFFQLDYRDFPSRYWKNYDAIILLAGYSSVQMSRNQFDTFDFNVSRFAKLLQEIPEKTKLIYASSGSVYGSNPHLSSEDDHFPKATNFYDMSKQLIDIYAELSDKQYYGLRFGTVCGFSHNPRMELMLNSMYLSAKRDGAINISNSDKYRAILSMKDLCRAILLILMDSQDKRGVYNVFSGNYKIGEIGNFVVGQTGCKVNILPDSPTYDFKLASDKFNKAFCFNTPCSPYVGRLGLQSIWEDLNNLDLSAIIGKESEYMRLDPPDTV